MLAKILACAHAVLLLRSVPCEGPIPQEVRHGEIISHEFVVLL